MNLEKLKNDLRNLAGSKPESAWPSTSLKLLAETGCFAAVVPQAYGGTELGGTERCRIYEAVAWGNMSVVLILTQHDGAVEFLIDSPNRSLAEQTLPGCARGEILTTVGISQLTTSRQGGDPAMKAQAHGDNGYRLDGVMPWVTAAKYVDYVIAGAVTEDGNQILAALPTALDGLEVQDPFSFLALDSSYTSEIHCSGVTVSEDHLLRGPIEQVLGRRSPVKSLTVSSCGIGMAGALLDAAQSLAESTPEIAAVIPLR